MTGDLRNIYALLLEPGVLSLREAALPADLPRHDYVRIKVSFCGLCGSDLAFFQGRPNAKYPRSLGHEHVGTVVLVGRDVPDFEVGDNVAVDPNYRCGSCYYCKSGASNLCESSQVNLFTYRGLSSFTDIHFSYLRRLSVLNPPHLGGLIEPLSCALHAIELARVKSDDRILILGAGSQGSLICFALSVDFPESAIEIYDPNWKRSANLTSCFGMVTALKASPTAPEYSLVFESSGQTSGFQNAALCVRKAGRIIVISRYRDSGSVYLPPDFPRKECRIVFSNLNGNGEPFDRAIRLLSENWLSKYNAWIDLRPLRDLENTLANLDQSPYCKTVIEVDETSIV